VLAFRYYVFIKDFDRNSFYKGLKIVVILLLGLFLVSLFYGWLLLSLRQLGPYLAGSSNSVIAALGTQLSLAGSAFAGVHENDKNR